jgi:hypothetical protein
MIRKLLLLIFSKEFRKLRERVITLERDNELFRHRELALHAELKNFKVAGGGC